MSKLAEFRLLERKLAEQLKELDALKGDKGLKKEIEFETILRNLLADYGFSLKNVVAVLSNALDVQVVSGPNNRRTANGARRKRPLRDCLLGLVS